MMFCMNPAKKAFVDARDERTIAALKPSFICPVEVTVSVAIVSHVSPKYPALHLQTKYAVSLLPMLMHSAALAPHGSDAQGTVPVHTPPSLQTSMNEFELSSLHGLPTANQSQDVGSRQVPVFVHSHEASPE